MDGEIMTALAIEETELGRKAKGIALGLLARREGRFVELSWAEAFALTECSSKGAVRRHLAALQAAGILAAWHSNGAVFCTLAAAPWPAPRHAAQPLREDVQPLYEDVQPVRADAQGMDGDAQSVCADVQPLHTDVQEIVPPHTPLIRIGGIGGGGDAGEESAETAGEGLAETLHRQTFGAIPAADRPTVAAFRPRFAESHLHEAYRQARHELDKGTVIAHPAGYVATILARLNRQGVKPHDDRPSKERTAARPGRHRAGASQSAPLRTAPHRHSDPPSGPEAERIWRILRGEYTADELAFFAAEKAHFG